MKITTWNVNGLRAALGKGVLDWVRQYEADVLCLQEVRARPEQLEEKTADRTCWLPSRTLTGTPPRVPVTAEWRRWHVNNSIETWLGLGDDRFDGEGRVIVTRYPAFLLYNIYFPNGGRDNGRVAYKLDFYARLLEICDKQHADGRIPGHLWRFQHLPPPDRPEEPQTERGQHRLHARRARVDRPLPGARLRRHLPPSLPRACPVHLVDLSQRTPASATSAGGWIIS